MSNPDLDDRAGVPLKRSHTIRLLPVNLFASIMGLAGLSLTWREAANLGIVGALPGELIGWTGIAVFIVLSISYGTKLALHPQAIVSEYAHPVMNNFFATITIGMLLLSAFLLPYNAALAQVVWVTGMVLTFIVAYDVMQRFLSRQHDGEHTLPALLIPGVATLDIAVTGSAMPFPWAHEINLLAFAVGSVIAGVLVVLIFGRLRHHASLPLAMQPSLLILVAPFAVGFLAYTNLTGRIDMFASSLFYFALFMLLVLAPKVLCARIPFSINWWAIGFPLAAMSLASFRYAAGVASPLLQAFAIALFACLIVAIGILFVRTLLLIISGRLFRQASAI